MSCADFRHYSLGSFDIMEIRGMYGPVWFQTFVDFKRAHPDVSRKFDRHISGLMPITEGRALEELEKAGMKRQGAE